MTCRKTSQNAALFVRCSAGALFTSSDLGSYTCPYPDDHAARTVIVEPLPSLLTETLAATDFFWRVEVQSPPWNLLPTTSTTYSPVPENSGSRLLATAYSLVRRQGLCGHAQQRASPRKAGSGERRWSNAEHSGGGPHHCPSFTSLPHARPFSFALCAVDSVTAAPMIVLPVVMVLKHARLATCRGMGHSHCVRGVEKCCRAAPCAQPRPGRALGAGIPRVQTPESPRRGAPGGAPLRAQNPHAFLTVISAFFFWPRTGCLKFCKRTSAEVVFETHRQLRCSSWIGATTVTVEEDEGARRRVRT